VPPHDRSRAAQIAIVPAHLDTTATAPNHVDHTRFRISEKAVHHRFRPKPKKTWVL
jgi:hypothetical protein